MKMLEAVEEFLKFGPRTELDLKHELMRVHGHLQVDHSHRLAVDYIEKLKQDRFLQFREKTGMIWLTPTKVSHLIHLGPGKKPFEWGGLQAAIIKAASEGYTRDQVMELYRERYPTVSRSMIRLRVMIAVRSAVEHHDRIHRVINELRGFIVEDEEKVN